MNIYHTILKALHWLYVKLFVRQFDAARDLPGIITNADDASDKIYKLLSSDKPCMIARFGSVELLNVTNSRSICFGHHSVWRYITNREREWWWNDLNCNQMQSNAGFFPNTKDNLIRFGHLICEDAKLLNILGSWVDSERYMEDLFPEHLERVHLILLEPFWSIRPWTKVLEGKRIVVVHPFAELIKKQYQEHRTELFKNPDVLPAFQLRIVKAVQSLGGENHGFQDWFEALDWMKSEIDKEDYDVALIGCGAYGFSLAAHVKRRGKKAVHLGGSLQLLFGIKGKRWDNPQYGSRTLGRDGSYLELFNEYWVYPDTNSRPKNAQKVEGACYW